MVHPNKFLQYVLVTLMFALLIPQSGLSQMISCDKSLKPISGQLGYKARGNRCEGLYDQPYGSSAELASLTVNRTAFPPNMQNQIVLELPRLEALADRQVRISVSAKVPEIYYRLDAQRALGSRFSWRVSDVLGEIGLGPEDLGYLAWIKDYRGQVFVPLIVDARIAGGRPFDSVDAVIRLSLPAETLYWKHYSLKTAGENSQPGWKRLDLVPGERTGFHTIRFPVSRKGLTQVNIRAKLIDRDQMDELDFQFAH